VSPASIRRALLAAAVAVASLVATAPANAGVYTVRQCDHAAGNGYHDFKWQASGSPAIARYAGSGCSEFGLAAHNGNVGVEQTYPSGGYGGWFAYAPTGTVFTGFAGAFGTISGCCVNGMTTYAEAANGVAARAYLFQGDLGNDSWYAPSGLQGPVGRSWSSSTSGFTAASVGFYLRCGPGFTCRQTRYGDVRLRGRSFDFTLRDDAAPTVAAPGGSLLSGGWQRGTRKLSFAAYDVGGGLTGVSALVDDGTALPAPSTCTVVAGRYARLQPCPLARSGAWNVDTSKLPDGARTVTVRAADVGSSGAQQTRVVHVDNTPPAAPLGAVVVGGDGWRRTSGFAIRWANPGTQHAPIARALFSACPAGDGGPAASPGRCATGQRPVTGEAGAASIAVPRSGQWDVRTWLEDAAGNADPTAASPPLRLRFDPDPPLLSFGQVDPAAPTRVTVYAADMSGIAAGAIELRRTGGHGWTALQTTRHGGRLTATIDDERLTRGHYELRARAADLAGNQAVAVGGERVLPVRETTRLRLTRARKRVRYGSRIVVRGRLRTGVGRPLAGRPVEAVLVSRDRTVRLRDARTDGAGAIVLALRARRSATVRLRFRGDDHALPSERRLAVVVPAPVAFRASGRAVGGRPALFRGRIRGGAIPPRGKLVEIQAHFRGRWRTISAVRTSRSGRWRFAYTFSATGRTARYRLRARVPAEARYPFADGTSRAIRVTVRPL
jgi:5-hydroxyisourate hydrolase-like protein (transthyretin family)